MREAMIESIGQENTARMINIGMISVPAEMTEEETNILTEIVIDFNVIVIGDDNKSFRKLVRRAIVRDGWYQWASSMIN